ncbi:ExbD/TolR family protein [Pleomorphochaeta sp. DL1XJH-081]|uniref:ExbD/TolR family protein n=1 Tax=Pleomorphochaeta sp. DL1XJH-081 TaxID=3409690 RepID=UPI003BB61636
MGRKRREQVGYSSDIAFLLIIFFLVMVGSTANRMLAIDSSDSQNIREDGTSLSHVVHLEILLDGTLQVVSTSAILPLSTIEQKDVVLHAHARVAWGQVVDALDTLSTYDVGSIGFATMTGDSISESSPASLEREEEP